MIYEHIVKISDEVIEDVFGPDYPDLPPRLIRCKDCKKRNTWECWQYFFGRMNLPDDYYCADGEAKEGEQE